MKYIYTICLFILLSVDVFSMKIENKYQINDTLLTSSFSKNRDSFFLETKTHNIYLNFEKDIIESKNQILNIDSIINIYEPTLVGNVRVFTKDRKYIIIKDKYEAFDFYIIDVNENTILRYNDDLLYTLGEEYGTCQPHHLIEIKVLEDGISDKKIILNYAIHAVSSKFSCIYNYYVAIDLNTKEISKYTLPKNLSYKEKSLDNSFNKNYLYFNRINYNSNNSSKPVGEHYSYVLQYTDINVPVDNKIFNAFTFKKTKYYSGTNYLYSEPNYDRTYNYGFIGYNDSTCFLSYNDSLFLLNFYTKQYTQKKSPSFKLSRVVNYYAGYDDKSMLILGTIIEESTEKYMICEFDLDNGKLIDSLHLFSSELTNIKNISIVGYNHELNLIITNYTDGTIYEIDNIKKEINNEKYAKLVINAKSFKLGETLEYNLETTNQINDFEAKVINTNNEMIASSIELKDSFLIQNSGDYTLVVTYKNQKNEEIKISKYFSIRNKLVCYFEVSDNIKTVPLEFKIIDKSEGDIIDKKYSFPNRPITENELNTTIVVNAIGKFPLTMTVSDGVETLSYTKYIHALEPKLSSDLLTETKLNELYAPFSTKTNEFYGNNYFQLSDKEHKEIKIFPSPYNNDNTYYLSRFEQNDTSFTLMNNIIRDYLYGEKLYQTNWSKDTLIGISKYQKNISYDDKIFINEYYKDTLRSQHEFNFDKPYNILSCNFTKNKILFILLFQDIQYLYVIDKYYKFQYQFQIDLPSNFQQNNKNLYNITETSEDLINFVVLQKKELFHKSIKLEKNKYELLDSILIQIDEINFKNFIFLGSFENNKPYLINRSNNGSQYNLFKILDNKTYQKIHIPLKIRNEGNLIFTLVDNKMLFINSDTANQKNYMYFDVFDYKKNSMLSKDIEDRKVKLRNINIDNGTLYMAGNIFKSNYFTIPYYAKLDLNKLEITSSVDTPDEPSDLIFDRKANSSINELNLEFVYTSDNIITIANENEKFTGDITIFDNSGVEVTNLGKLDFIKGENSIDLNNNGLNYKVFFMKIHSEGKNSIYKFIYIK